MKTVILAGGKGLRMSGYGNVPKPLVEIGGKCLLWHVMRIYAAQYHSDFVIAGGYFVHELRAWLNDHPEIHDWAGDVRIVDTGWETPTGGRLKILADQGLIGYETFMATYVDGLADINLDALRRHHIRYGRAATVTAVRPHSQFGILDISPDGLVEGFREKPLLDDWVNGGFFMLEPEALEEMTQESDFEHDILPALAARRGLSAYMHDGYWRQCDNPKDVNDLEEVWQTSRPWAVWEKARR